MPALFYLLAELAVSSDVFCHFICLQWRLLLQNRLMTVLGIWKTYFENTCKRECQQEKSVLCHWRGRCRFFIFVQIKSKWHCLVLYIAVLQWLSLFWFSSVSRFEVRITNFARILLHYTQYSTLLIPNAIVVNTNLRRIGCGWWAKVQFR